MDEDEAITLEPFLRKLETYCPLDGADRDAVLRLPWRRSSAKAADYILREGDPSSQVMILASGLVYRHKVAGTGLRQIVGIMLPGDAIDLQSIHLSAADHNVQCLTAAEIAAVPRGAIHDLMLERPQIGRAILTGLCVDLSISREWVLNLGRRNALARVAHLLCEFGARLDALGSTPVDGYHLPMNQQQIADATGLTSVHVNRMLKTLRERGFLGKRGQRVTYTQWEPMRDIGDFSERYLFHANLG